MFAQFEGISLLANVLFSVYLFHCNVDLLVMHMQCHTNLWSTVTVGHHQSLHSISAKVQTFPACIAIRPSRWVDLAP